jgi:RES domain-containing protein
MVEIGQPALSALLAADPGGPTPRRVAAEIDRVLRRHFRCEAQPAWQVGVGNLSHEYKPVALEDTIRREAGVSVGAAGELAGLIRGADKDKFHWPHWRYVNHTERQACLRTFWPGLRGENLDPVSLNDDEANALMHHVLAMIESASAEVFRSLDAGTVLWRGRTDENFSLYEEVRASAYAALGAHPKGPAHRLNPEGVRCFYGASDVQTSLSEQRVETGWIVYLGKFATTRQLPVLDLHKLAEAKWPSVFLPDYEQRVRDFGLVRSIPFELSHAPWKGGNDHAYRPARYFAEYCRQRQRDRIAGIVYPSSQHPSGFNVALFADTWDGNDDPVRLQSIHTTQVVSRTTKARSVDVGLPGVEPLTTDE